MHLISPNRENIKNKANKANTCPKRHHRRLSLRLEYHSLRLQSHYRCILISSVSLSQGLLIKRSKQIPYTPPSRPSRALSGQHHIGTYLQPRQTDQRTLKLGSMDQVHTRALEALQPFIHLANSNSATSPRFVANLITNATSNPHTYVFAELLETPTVQALRSKDTADEYQPYLTLLEIFAWGTWQEYQCENSKQRNSIYTRREY